MTGWKEAPFYSHCYATYRVRKTWADSKSQIGAYKSLERAIKVADEHEGYKVYDSNGACVYEPVKIGRAHV